jgi:hypothetical protein
MTSIFCSLRGAAIAALVATPALAQSPAYVGTWASEPVQCRVGQEEENAPMIMRRDGYDRHETHCKFSSVSPKGAAWTVKARCMVEGNNVNISLTLSVTGNRLTIRDERGPSTYLRCR